MPVRPKLKSLWASSRVRVAAISIVIFLVSLAYELWRALPHGLDTLFYGLPSETSIATLQPILGTSDAGSYLTAAVDLQDGSISAANVWVLNLWPPGMPYLLALMIKLGGGASPVVPMIVLICVLWSTAIGVLAAILLQKRTYISFALFAVFWLLSPIFTAWTITAGVLGSDGLATALGTLVATGIIWAGLAPAARRPRWVLYVFLGIGLSALAYLRILWFYAVPAALAVLLLLTGVRAIVLVLRKRWAQLVAERRSYIEWGALGAAFIVLCLPWTIYGEAVLHPGSYSWSQGDYQWSQEWMSDDYLNSHGAGFLETGGANWPCEIAPVKCEMIAAQELASPTPYGGQVPNTFAYFEHQSIKVAIGQPTEFVANRSTVMVRAWLSSPGGAVGAFDNVWFGALTLIGFVAAMLILAWQSLRQRAAPLVIFLILGANIGVVWLTHFETRYLVPVQAISLVVLAFAALPWEPRLRERFARRRATDRAAKIILTTADDLSPNPISMA